MLFYETNIHPEQNGVYACRIDDPDNEGFVKDEFLFYDK